MLVELVTQNKPSCKTVCTIKVIHTK